MMATSAATTATAEPNQVAAEARPMCTAATPAPIAGAEIAK
jgi:hypothetical protein